MCIPPLVLLVLVQLRTTTDCLDRQWQVKCCKYYESHLRTEMGEGMQSTRISVVLCAISLRDF